MQGREHPFFSSSFFFFYLSPFFFAKKTKQTCCNTAFCVCMYVRMRVYVLGAKKFIYVAFFFLSLCLFLLFKLVSYHETLRNERM